MILFTISKKSVKKGRERETKGGNTDMTPEWENTLHNTPEWENTLHSNDILSLRIEGNTVHSSSNINIVTSLKIKHKSPKSKLYLKTVTISKGTYLQQPKNRG